MPRLIVITGPTASGKTVLSLEMAERYHVPIINADSRQIYRDLPIGTAAPTPDELARVQHFFVGTHELNQTFNAGQFETQAIDIINRLIQRLNDPCSDEVVAILSGGSMLYIHAVLNGLDDIPSVAESLRNELRAEYKERGLKWLQEEVQRLDPDYWDVVDKQNPQRLLHCVELCRATGRTFSSMRRSKPQKRPFDAEVTVLMPPREQLYERINQRVLQMIENGLIEEANRAFTKTMGDSEWSVDRLPNSLRTVGYQELIPFFRGDCSLSESVELIRQHTRNYAKRQLTWWRNKG